ncbi:hypothetical protein O6H91_20G068600 [Diphasiastrum complanatum]|uniref:Uncharacterized protein n=2 Tax=Diphasiastrum complanatum TaxID=34168 RepID=A0ACC2ASI4_DIPCM|nr:hypothetical protein O6H91_20G068600 [Diphasiastrum complanatum]KAJ7520142.1 hypothetical protein O6H91_20G068600 [Diphasiastrum complanatum]
MIVLSPRLALLSSEPREREREREKQSGGEMSAVKQKSALKERTQSPGRLLLSPNNDDYERAQARAARAALQRRRSFVAADSEGTPAPLIDSSSCDGIGDLLSESQIKDLFQNCIKLAAENKINQQNTWELKLIDHLSDLVKCDASEDTQTNFQKASCTLEASAKIYSYRVDSVHSETYKVLGGINRTSANTHSPEIPENGADTALEQEDARRETQRKSTSSATLESFEVLNVKKFDVAFNVDPLFHQTSAQFDEGGAKGLLLNTLSVYRGCELIFDSWDVPEKTMRSYSHSGAKDSPSINLSFLKDSIDWMMESMRKEHTISLTLKDITKLLDDPCRKLAEETSSVSTMTFESTWFDPESNDQENDNSDIVDDVDEQQFENVDLVFNNIFEGSPDSSSQGTNFPQNVEESEVDNGELQDVIINDERSETNVDETLAGISILSSKNSWAGPEHWKYMKPREYVNAEEKLVDSLNMKKKRKGQPFCIDFTKAVEQNMSFFDAPPDLRTNLLPQSKHYPSTLLPVDHHYQVADLFRLFLRSLAVWQCVRGRQPHDSDKFAQRQAYSEDHSNEASWNHEEFDNFDEDPCGDNFQSDVGNSTPDGLIRQPRKVQKIEVSYDKTSKQVDVRILKATLWEHLNRPPAKEEGYCGEGISFQRLLKCIPDSCPAAAPEDVSVHLCFICLLHLANEHNLFIKGCSTMDELYIETALEGSR